MNIDATVRLDLFQIALLCGGLFGAYRVLLTVLYPLLSGAIWQYFLGPIIQARWHGAAQCEDQGRPSYLPRQKGQPYVLAWGLLPPPVDDLTHGFRDGLLLGMLAALMPEILPLVLAMSLALTIAIGIWRVSRHNGAARTDHVFWAARNLLIFVGAIVALHAAQIW